MTRLGKRPPSEQSIPSEPPLFAHSHHPEGYWQMHCFNALSTEQQRMVVEDGYLPIGWKPEGTVCDKPADLEVTTKWDEFPGPRFYCVECAVKYLQHIPVETL